MQVTAQQRSECEIELKIEVEAEKVAETLDQVYREFAGKTEVPGFRKGKAPRQILERYVSPESVRRRAVDIMVPAAYRQALEQEKIEPYAEPEAEIIQLEADQPFVFKATVPLPPKVELGEYKGIEVKRPPVNLTDEDIDAQLKHLQESRATTENVTNRGIQTGDIAVAQLASAVEGQEMAAPRSSLIEIGSNISGFDENVIGLRPGERRTFTTEYPQDYSDKEFAGKKVDFDISLESIRERLIPELNDEFANTIGNFETLADLREDLRARLTSAAEESADKEVEQKMVDEVAARSQVSFPDVLVEHEVGHHLEDIRDRLDRQGLTMQHYLRQIGKTQEELLSELREAAARRVKAGLVLAELSDAEKIEVTDEEVDAEIERMATESKATRESVETYIDTRGGRPALKNSLLTKKAMDFLKSVSKVK